MAEQWEGRGHLHKMQAVADKQGAVSYHLRLDEELFPLDGALGRQIRLEFQGAIHCQSCGRRTKKSFNQGYCYNCFRKLARCDSCIMSPEKCHFPAGTCREPEWGEANCQTSHIVYLANSTGLKVGITRESQLPTRWLDQGAAQATPLFRVPQRRLSGLVEDTLREWVGDRTQWQRLLKGPPEPLDMKAEARRLKSLGETLLSELEQHEGQPFLENLQEDVQEFHYPVEEYPTKVKSLNLDKTPEIEGTLLGIKGQYLLLDTGCLNVRKHTAYDVAVSLK